MACHTCGNNAVGLCRQCFKFYCQEHGDAFCSSCQQRGWEMERFTGAIGRDVEGVSTAASLSVTEGPSSVRILNGQEPAAEAEGKKAEGDAEKQPKDRWQSAYYHHRPDQERIDDLTEPAKFVGILPTFGANRLNDVLMLFKGIDLYEGAFLFELSISFGSQSDNSMMHRHPMLHEVTLRDNAGTVYQAHQHSGSGSERDWLQRYFVASPLNRAATQLTLEVPRLQIMEHVFLGRGRMQPGQIFLNGPWIITCAVPPRDERIVLQ